MHEGILHLLSENVTSLPNFVVVYSMNFSLLSKKVLFIVDPVVNICTFNSLVLRVYKDTTVIAFPPLFFFLCLAFWLFPFLSLLDLGTSGVLD